MRAPPKHAAAALRWAQGRLIDKSIGEIFGWDGDQSTEDEYETARLWAIGELEALIADPKKRDS